MPHQNNSHNIFFKIVFASVVPGSEMCKMVQDRSGKDEKKLRMLLGMKTRQFCVMSWKLHEMITAT